MTPTKKSKRGGESFHVGGRGTTKGPPDRKGSDSENNLREEAERDGTNICRREVVKGKTANNNRIKRGNSRKDEKASASQNRSVSSRRQPRACMKEKESIFSESIRGRLGGTGSERW